VEIRLGCNDIGAVSTRAYWFLKRFPFVRDVEMSICDIVLALDNVPTTKQGYYNYVRDGYFNYEDLYALMPNAALERGVRLEKWLPEFDIDWSVPNQFEFHPEEEVFADRFYKEYGPYAVFYLGPMNGNTTCGHNRGALWTPNDWAELGHQLQSKGMNIICVGAAYDREYWDMAVKHRAGTSWVDCIGAWEIATTLAVIRNASLTVSYQSGIEIMSTYFGIPTVMWWRAKGDSCNAKHFVSFEEAMKDAWVPLSTLESGNYLGLIYERQSPAEIVKMMEERNWL